MPRTSTRTYVCPPNHPHGKNSTCYSGHKCGCQDCLVQNSARMARRRKLIAYGRFEAGTAPVEPVREHIDHLAKHHYSHELIAAKAGISTRTVWRIHTGRAAYVQTRVSRSILATTPDLDDLDGRTIVENVGTSRRLQALAARGWSCAALARELGMDRAGVSRFFYKSHVAVDTHRAIVALYERLWNVEPPAATPRDRSTITMTLRHARARRWVPPLGWDDIDTDPTPPVPEPIDGDVDEVAIELAISDVRVRLTTPERRVVVTRLNALGHADSYIAEHADCDARTVLRIRQTLHLPAAVGADGERIAS